LPSTARRHWRGRAEGDRPGAALRRAPWQTYSPVCELKPPLAVPTTPFSSPAPSVSSPFAESHKPRNVLLPPAPWPNKSQD
jgi:hypothetical protein